VHNCPCLWTGRWSVRHQNNFIHVVQRAFTIPAVDTHVIPSGDDPFHICLLFLGQPFIEVKGYLDIRRAKAFQNFNRYIHLQSPSNLDMLWGQFPVASAAGWVRNISSACADRHRSPLRWGIREFPFGKPFFRLPPVLRVKGVLLRL